jgi:hypothetical protein
MKKSLLILSLFFAASSVFSGNNAGSGLNLATEIASNYDLNIPPAEFNIVLDDNYVLTGTLIKTGANNYSYLAVLMHGLDIIGTVSGSFQVAMVNGQEVMIEGSLVETYSNEETEEVCASKTGNNDKSPLQNVR